MSSDVSSICRLHHSAYTTVAADAELSTLRRQVGANHRMVSTYLNTLHRHGLWLDQMSEPAPAEQWSRSRPGTGRVPVYLAAICLKAAVPG
jgi:hypothetical protein